MITSTNAPTVCENPQPEQPQAGPDPDRVRGLLTNRELNKLHPHPSYAKNELTVPTWKLDALAKLGDLAFHNPLIVTHSGAIIDGNTRLELAKLQGRSTLTCLEYEMTDEQALQLILRMQRGSGCLNSFNRIILALDLEPWLKQQARANQILGGQNKRSSKLTEAEKIDVRAELASEAGVSPGNVTKVKQLITTAQFELLQALRAGEIRIHRAWKLSKQSAEEQSAALRLYRSSKGLKKSIRHLISRHKSSEFQTPFDPSSLFKRLSSCDPKELRSLNVLVLKIRGKSVYVTEELLRSLSFQKELFVCETESQ